MEPYRPFVDHIVWEMVARGENVEELTTQIKAELLTIPAMDVYIDGRNSPLTNADEPYHKFALRMFLRQRAQDLIPWFSRQFSKYVKASGHEPSINFKSIQKYVGTCFF